MTDQILMDKKENCIHTQSIEPHLYNSDDTFYEGDSMLHSEYGEEVVISSYANKIDVRFKDQVVTLEHKIIF